jgi:hypothetical protein
MNGAFSAYGLTAAPNTIRFDLSGHPPVAVVFKVLFRAQGREWPSIRASQCNTSSHTFE